MNRCRVGGKEDVCLPEPPDTCYILPVTSLVNNIILSWPGTVKDSLHSISTCNIPLIQNDPGRSSLLTVRASPGFEPGSPDWETNALPTRPNRLPYYQTALVLISNVTLAALGFHSISSLVFAPLNA